MSNPVAALCDEAVSAAQAWLCTWQSLGGVVTAVVDTKGIVSEYRLTPPDAEALTPNGREKLLRLQGATPEQFAMRAALTFEASMVPDEGTMQ